MKKEPGPVLDRSMIAHTARAELIGSDTCTAAGLCGHGNTPVLALARTLIAAGMNPNAALEVYRGGVLALHVRSIVKAASSTVRDNRLGSPQFRLAEVSLGDAGASPIRQKPRLSGSAAFRGAASQQQGVG